MNGWIYFRNISTQKILVAIYQLKVLVLYSTEVF